MTLPFLVILTSMEEPNPRRRPAVEHLSSVFGDAFPGPHGIVEGVDASRPGFESRCLPLRHDAPALLPGYRANAAAHAQAWTTLLRSDANHALVLEDDARILCPVPRLVRIYEALPVDYDWCRLVDQRADGPAQMADDWPVRPPVRDADPVWGTAAYLVSRTGAAFLLSHVLPQYTTVDCVLHYRARRGRAFVSNGSAAAPDPSFPSLILPADWVTPAP